MATPLWPNSIAHDADAGTAASPTDLGDARGPTESATQSGTSKSSMFSLDPIAMIAPMEITMLGASIPVPFRHRLTKNHTPSAKSAVPSDASCSLVPVDRAQMSAHIQNESAYAVTTAPSASPANWV